MLIFIKNGKDFATRAMARAHSYDFAVASLYGEPSTLTCGLDVAAQPGDLLIAEGDVQLIAEVSADETQQEIVSQPLRELFSRELFYEAPHKEETVQAFVVRMIHTHFIAPSDSKYAKDWLRAEVVGESGQAPQPAEETALWKLSDYILQAEERFGLRMNSSLHMDGVRLSVGKPDGKTYKLDASLPTCEVLEQCEGENAAAKVSVQVQEGSVQHYYRLLDGSITQDGRATNRAEGSWRCLYANTQQQGEQQAVEWLQAGQYEHLLEFCTHQNMGYLGALQVRLPSGRLLHSYITEQRKKSGDDRYYYKAGEQRSKYGDALRKQQRKRG